MKKIFIVFAVISALTLNTLAYNATYGAYGREETDEKTFSVRFSAHLQPVEEETETYETDTSESIDVPSEDTSEPTENESTYYDTEETFDMATFELDGDTAEETTAEQTETQKDVFGGEGTVLFSKEQLKILSVTPLFPEGIGYEIYQTDDFCRFMFYSSISLEENFPLFDIEFEILSVDENECVSVSVTEGLFSDGTKDTPTEEFTYTVKVNGFAPVTTAPPPPPPPVTDTATEEITTHLPEQTETDALTSTTGTAIVITNGMTASPSSHTPSPPKDEENEDNNTAVIIAVTAISVAALTAGTIIVAVKTKKK